MFERFTERARRVLFFSRYEASQLGSISIETEHLLLGLIREGKGVTRRIFAEANVDLETLRKEAESAAVFKEKVSTSVEIPFSGEVKRVLTYTSQEADRLEHSYIGAEHLLLGLLREESSKAGVILAARGLHYDAVRKDLLRFVSEAPDPSLGPETPAELVATINQIKRKVSTLADMAGRADDGGARAIDLAEAIHRDLERLKPRPSS